MGRGALLGMESWGEAAQERSFRVSSYIKLLFLLFDEEENCHLPTQLFCSCHIRALRKVFKWCCITVGLLYVIQQPLSKDRGKKVLISGSTVQFLFANKIYFQL